MNRKKSSISKKFITLFTIAILIFTILVGGIIGYFLQTSLTYNSQRELSLVCENEASQINLTLSNIKHSVEILAQSSKDGIDSVKTLSNEETRDIFTEKMNDQIMTSANSTDGCVAAYLRYNPSFTPPTSGILMQKSNISGKMENIAPTDFTKYSSEDIEHVGWYYIPIQTGHPAWLEPYYNQNIRIYMISYVVPLYVKDAPVGVIGMDIDFDLVTQYVSRINLYDSGHAFLLSQSDTVIWHKKYDFGTSYVFRNNMEYQSCELDNGMKLVIEVPRSEIYKDRNVLLAIVAGLGIILLGSALFFVKRSCDSIVKPLIELTEKAHSLNSGNMDLDFHVDSDDEVGFLAETLQETTVRLKHYIDMTTGLAYIDSLTGIKNKTAYDTYVEKINADIESGSCENFAVVMCDVNNLKVTNDTYGHEFGNVLIINSCKLICRVFMHSPVFRVGGDEFVVLLEGSDYKERQEVLHEFEEMMSFTWGRKYKYEQLSIAYGMSEYDRGNDKSIDDAFKRADMKMYEKKGRMKEARRIAEEGLDV